MKSPKPEPVTRLDEARGDNSHRWPAFLPDGVHFLYFVRSFEDQRRGVHVGRADRPGEPPGARLLESESAAVYAPLESDSTGAVMTVVPDGIRIQRRDAAARRLFRPRRRASPPHRELKRMRLPVFRQWLQTVDSAPGEA